MRVAGLMSGTSLDAIDVAVVEITADDAGGLELEVLQTGEEAWPDALLARIGRWLADPDASVPLGELAITDMAAGAALADALLAVLARSSVDPRSLDLVVSHGQTVHHHVSPEGAALATLQIGQPAIIAERIGCAVVADLRPRDIAAGGQGAPLVALFDALVFGEADRDVAVLNLGGIANVTIVPAGHPERSVAWDTGPANAILDALARREGRDRDEDGTLAAAGRPDEALLDELLADPWFAAPAPKSTGRERFGDAYAAALAARGLSLADRSATATALSARSIARSLRDHSPAWPTSLWLGGGGTSNPALVSALADALRRHVPSGASAPELRTVDEAGIPSGSKEAIAFAFLGHETLHGRPSSLVGATGARHPSVLGAIWPAGPPTHDHAPEPTREATLEPLRRLRVRGVASQRTGADRP